MTDLSQDQWKKAIAEDQSAVVLDVRTPSEWAEGIQKNAECINFLDTQNFSSAILDLDPKKTYYVYCRSGGRSVSACQMLESSGFTQTFNLLGGMLEWDGEVVDPPQQNT